ncbi:MAG: PLP-dependent cysteine synthase family protein [Cetobacterium sp.]|uniref:PLP-dependent cysteine synthase family protein n=1 Tax=Cetobacterium sp. ZWU0022 TaxID=1340502 RepID=UPI000648BDBA|nr:cysteine synthase family protein [Cetobacterium sp. ZWU0022]
MNILNYVGRTPIVKIKNLYGEQYPDIYLKLEEFNPGGSIKTRVGFEMIRDAEDRGMLKKGDTLIEATGGNTGLGLAIAASLKGYKLKLVIPDNFSKEKINILKEYGAEIIYSNHELGNNSHLIKLKEILSENKTYINLNQFENISNPNAHYLFTGKEIINSLKKIDYFVSVMGSGGTIAGISKCLKEHNLETKIIGVQPEGCDIFNGIFIPHKIQATAVGVIPKFINRTDIDEMISVDYNEVQIIRERLAKEQGIFVGISSGANLLAALKLSKSLGKERVIVTISPDSGRSYL